MTDVETGELLDRYKINPFAGEASQKIRTEALGTGPSIWAQLATQQQQAEQAKAAGQAAQQAQTAQSQAQANLARMGGLSGGARSSLARQGMKSQMGSLQDISQAGALARLGIGQTDAERRQKLLGSVAQAEAGAQAGNVNQLMSDLSARGSAEQNRYNQQMQAWAAIQAANAARDSAKDGGNKGMHLPGYSSDPWTHFKQTLGPGEWLAEGNTPQLPSGGGK
jgi:hypothetical protein